MKIAIFIDRDWLIVAYAYNSFRLILEIHADATVLSPHIDE